ncbi:hypothetical protein [Hymenobacter actinosclerus]|uniref:Uncharacterized protein n=1 Tax=Hymenobacter actinosclerus TaxID=82805 RepID=A0A1I0HZE9_9BACT|nr:hypothetical protein [Hymenobacter actinosclerus]SET88721.1 hypothetical protein SAMN04487998_3010 [Hymenobacter actinosclerus]
MFKTLLFLLLAFAMMLEPAPARATAGASAAGTALLAPATTTAGFFRRTPRKGRPNYMKYKGANRTKLKKLGPVRRWKLRRKAQAKRRTHVPSVKAGAPTRVMKK